MPINIQAAIEETSFSFDGLEHETAIDFLETLLDLLDTIKDDGYRAAYSSELFGKSVLGSLTFYDLYGENSPITISYEVRERVAAVFSSMLKWDDADDWPDTFDVSISDGSQSMPTVGWLLKSAASQATDGCGAVCFGSPLALRGEFSVSAAGNTEPIWFFADEVGYRSFLRSTCVRKCKNADDLCDMSKTLFPALEFVNGVFDGIRDMSKSFRDLAPAIVGHLGALSDHGARVFAGPWSSAPAEFGALGIELSDENGKTKQNSNAKRARQIEYNGRDVIFWWHTKIGPDRDRIHFDPSELSSGGKIVVGIFCRHLVT